MSGWSSAIKKPWTGKSGAGAYTVKPPEVRVEEVKENDEVFTDEQKATCARYMTALRELHLEDKRFDSNYATFTRWNWGMQLWWIGQIEKQARDGKDTIGVHVVTRVIMNRME